MLRMMSVTATSSSSVGRFVTCALLIRSRVDELVSISHRTQVIGMTYLLPAAEVKTG